MSRLPAELLKNYELTIVICRHPWTNYLVYILGYHCPGESACSYAIALEATLRSVEDAPYGSQPFPDRDGKLTRQFMRGLRDEEVFHRIALIRPRLLSELQADCA